MGNNYNNELLPTKVIALMSGKGGSGKTIITATMGLVASQNNVNSILVDFDFGTGGLTYFLGLKQTFNKKKGLVNILDKKSENSNISDYLQEFKNNDRIKFLGLGDHRSIAKRNLININNLKIFGSIINNLRTRYPSGTLIFVDCRGGFDEYNLQIAKEVDDIILLVEPDTTSFQATQFISESLVNQDLGNKIKGFIINKVFDNPVAVSTNGIGIFGGEYLASIPFDLEAMRSFLVGEIQSGRNYFYRHVWYSLSNAYPKYIERPYSNIIRDKDFSNINILNPNAQFGGTILWMIITSFLISIITSILLSPETKDNILKLFADNDQILLGFIATITLFIFNSSNRIKENLGRTFKNLFRK